MSAVTRVHCYQMMTDEFQDWEPQKVAVTQCRKKKHELRQLPKMLILCGRLHLYQNITTLRDYPWMFDIMKALSFSNGEKICVYSHIHLAHTGKS